VLLRGNLKRLRDNGCGYTAEEEVINAIQVPKTPGSGRGRPKAAKTPKSGGSAKGGADDSDEDEEVKLETPSKKSRGGGRKKKTVKEAAPPAVLQNDDVDDEEDMQESVENMHHGQFFDALEEI
jgi:hypothetical protein